MIERIEQLAAEAREEIAAARSAADLEQVRVRFLGRKAELPMLLRGVGALEPAERAAVGHAANDARSQLESLLEERSREIAAQDLEGELAHDAIDVTLPGSPAHAVGRLHLLTDMRRELEDIFLGLGFTVVEGPEIETVHYNFDALNHSPTHPARALTDTFYLARDGHGNDDDASGAPASDAGPDALVLRTHTSPMQVRAMEAHPPPLYVVIPGRVYRP